MVLGPEFFEKRAAEFPDRETLRYHCDLAKRDHRDFHYRPACAAAMTASIRRVRCGVMPRMRSTTINCPRGDDALCVLEYARRLEGEYSRHPTTVPLIFPSGCVPSSAINGVARAGR